MRWPDLVQDEVAGDLAMDHHPQMMKPGNL
jgi:hypothetical protein